MDMEFLIGKTFSYISSTPGYRSDRPDEKWWPGHRIKCLFINGKDMFFEFEQQRVPYRLQHGCIDMFEELGDGDWIMLGEEGAYQCESWFCEECLTSHFSVYLKGTKTEKCDCGYEHTLRGWGERAPSDE